MMDGIPTEAVAQAAVVHGAAVPLPPDVPKAEPSEEHRIAEIQSTFLGRMQSLRKALVLVLPHAADWLKKEITETEAQLLASFGPLDGTPDRIKAMDANEQSKALVAIYRRQAIGGLDVLTILQRSLFMQAFCEYDAFIGSLLKELYSKNEDLLRAIPRQFTLTDLLDYGTIEAAKLGMLDKEVDSIRRDSYVEQFTSMESRFKVKLRSFSEWPEFVELSQRRNIMTHNGDIVSDQYLAVCAREGFVFNDAAPKPGTQLVVEPTYVVRAITLISRVGFMLSHSLWRKLYPKEAAVADQTAGKQLYNMLIQKSWALAAYCGQFCIEGHMASQLTDVDLRIRTINAAIGLKFSNRSKDCEKLLGALDWSAANRDFKLARAVLLDENDEAAQIMRSIGKDGELVNQVSYLSWPLFNKFRETQQFRSAYEEIYGESFLKEMVKNEGAKGVESPSHKAEISAPPTPLVENASPDLPDARSAETALRSSTGLNA